MSIRKRILIRTGSSWYALVFIFCLVTAPAVAAEAGERTDSLPLAFWQTGPALLGLDELSQDDLACLFKGEIPTSAIAAGVFLSVFPGYGLGQAVQGRMLGWPIIAGEAAGMVLLAVPLMYNFVGLLASAFVGYGAMGDSWSDTAIWCIPGLVIFTVFKIWEIGDAWLVPVRQNERYRYLVR